MLPTVTNGLLLNAGVIGVLAILAVLSAVGEFTIRNFIMGQKIPAFIVREIHTRSSPASDSSAGCRTSAP